MSRVDAGYVWATRISIVGMTAYGLWQVAAGHSRVGGYIIAGALIVALLALYARHMFGLVPSWLVFLLAIFMVLGSCLGFGYGMYGKWWPWDDWMHGISGVLFGLFGVVLADHLARIWAPKLPVWVRIGLATLFAVFVALIWELYEFGSDLFLGTFFQQNDLYDTMVDLLYGGLWGFIGASSYYAVKKLSPRFTRKYLRD